MEEIIRQIKSELKSKKITYEDFSKICNIPTGSLRNIFSGQQDNPGIKTVNIMLEALELNQYEKSPQGTFLTAKEKEILDEVVTSSEYEQDLIIAYIKGLRDKSPLK